MGPDPFSISLVVVCLVIIWIVLGVMFIHRYWPHKIASPQNQSSSRDQVHTFVSYSLLKGVVSLGAPNEDVSGNVSDSLLPSNNVTITVDPPTCGDNPKSSQSSNSSGRDSCSTTSTDSSHDGSQLTLNGATGGRASSEGSSNGSHSDMSEFHSLHSNDEPKRSPPKDPPKRDLLSAADRMSQPHTLSTNGDNDERDKGITNGQTNGGPHSELSGFHTLHSNDKPQNVTLNGNVFDQRASGGPNSDISAIHSLHSNDQPQKRIMNGQTNDGPQSELSGFHSLHSNDETQEMTTNGHTNGRPQSDQSGFRSLHSNDKPQKRITNGQTNGGPHSEPSGFHSLHSNDKPPKMITNGQTNDGPQSELSVFHTLHSNDTTQEMTLNGKVFDQRASGGPHSNLSAIHSLHSNDQSHKGKPSVDIMKMVDEDGESSHSGIMSKPGTLASTEIAIHVDDDSKVTSVALMKTGNCKFQSSDMMSQPGTLASTEVVPSDDSKASQYISRPLSDVEGSSTVSSFRSLRSTCSNNSPQRRWVRPLQRDPSHSLPAISENDSEDIAMNKRPRWRSLE